MSPTPPFPAREGIQVQGGRHASKGTHRTWAHTSGKDNQPIKQKGTIIIRAQGNNKAGITVKGRHGRHKAQGYKGNNWAQGGTRGQGTRGKARLGRGQAGGWQAGARQVVRQGAGQW